MICIDIDVIRNKTKKILFSIGFSQKEIFSILNSWEFASLSEKYSHGFDRLPWLDSMVKKGKVIPNSKIRVSHKNQLVVNITGKKSLGYLAADTATEEVIKLANKNDIGFATLYNVYPTGCMGQYVSEMVNNNYIGFVITHSSKRVAPYKGNTQVFSTCGHSFGFPADEIPYIYDSSVGATTNGEIMLLHKKRKDLPIDAVLTKEGISTIKTCDVVNDEGVFTGIIKVPGGNNSHKFSGLAGSLELFTQLAILDMPKDVDSYSFFMCLNPTLFGNLNEYKNLVSKFQEEIKSSNNNLDVHFAGEQSYYKRIKNKQFKKIYITEETYNFLDKC